MSAQATLLIVDDHPSVASGLRTMVEPPYQVLEVAHHGDDVLPLVDRLRPALVLMDLSLPGKSGVVLTRELKARPDCPRILAVTMHAEPTFVREVLRAGADGYLLKTARAAEIRHAIAEVLAGHRYVTPEVILPPEEPRRPTPVPDTLSAEMRALLAQLSDKQLAVLQMIGEGCSSEQAAERMELSERTVEYHRGRIREILGLTTQAGLFRVATLYVAAQAAGEAPGDAPG
ncbi:MAG: response regulator transcription factor [Gemmatimonadetes bacterium]|nr:response regulator transcription factor [Gemmatimonadota bacterium]